MNDEEVKIFCILYLQGLSAFDVSRAREELCKLFSKSYQKGYDAGCQDCLKKWEASGEY